MSDKATDYEAPLMPETDLSTAAGQAQAVTFYTDSVHHLNASGKTQRQLISDLKINPDNPRIDYDVDGMIASYRHKGFVIGAPITVSKQKDGTLLVLRGNRRVSAAQKMAETDPDGFKKVFPDGKIPCVVLSDLSRAEEGAVLIDHGRELDRRKLSPREEVRAIKVLIRAGVKGRDAIARALDLVTRSVDEKTGKETEKVRGSYVQPRLNLLALPAVIQERYLTESSMFDGENTVLKQATIAPLFTAMGEDRKAGEIGADGFGPKLKAAWETLLATPATAVDAPVKFIAESKSKGLLQEVDSKVLTDAITYLGGFSKTMKLSEIDSRCQALEASQVMLARIADFVGATEFASLCEKADRKAEEKAAQEAKAQEASKGKETVKVEEGEAVSV